MSYILDALRRADAERQQGQVPGLHAAATAFVPAPAPQRKAVAWWGAGALLLALGVLLVSSWPRPQALPAALPPQAAAGPAAVAEAGPQAAVAVPVAAAPTPASAIAPPPVLPIVVSAAAAVPALAAAPAAAARLPAPASASALADSAAAGPLSKPVPLHSLDAEQRRALPRLVVGGSVWSDNAANRFIILDGQMLREGDAVASGLVLERIQPKSAVLRWRDLRLELAL